MCGISGIWDREHRLSPIAPMMEALHHRGPDDEGYLFLNTDSGDSFEAGGAATVAELKLPPVGSTSFENYDLAFGSRRLAILDLSSAGHMPMPYGGGKLWITYNGEIYNYLELREELGALGHAFSSHSDTEVILAAYAEWGIDCLSHFNGMFAFALWDAYRQRLFCARDRFGIKPFYYHWDRDAFFFASEIKSLLQHPAVPRKANDQAIFDYLSRLLSDHNDQSFFDDIHSLPPAHFLVIDISTMQLTIEQWWQASINPEIGVSSRDNGEEVYSEFRALLEDAIRVRLRSDVPVGTCLSGGLDSSSIVCLANELLMREEVVPSHLVGEHQKTFTARNKEAEIDEYQYSHMIVQQTGADEHLIYPSGEMLWQELERFVWHMDEPVESTSMYHQWNVMRLASQHDVTVLLDGQGGDEILAGYYYYYPPYLSQIRQQQGLASAARAGWDIARIGGAPAVEMLWGHAVNRLPWRLQQLARFVHQPKPTPGGGGSGLTNLQLDPGFAQRFWERRWRPDGPVDADGLMGLLYRDLTSTNLPKLLRYEDRNSMAFSLETRLPFLDYRLVEMVFKLPLSSRIHDGWSKWILRRAMKDILPPEISWRRNKLGFPTPEKTWLLGGSRFIRQLLLEQESGPIQAYLHPGLLQQMVALSDLELATTPGLWRIINLIAWFKVFFSPNGSSPL